MNRYRCYMCLGPKGIPGYDFRADAPICPQCTRDARTRFGAGKILPLVDIHLERGHPTIPGEFLREPACGVQKSIFGLAATDDPNQVTCEQCQATGEFQAVKAKRGGYDVPAGEFLGDCGGC